MSPLKNCKISLGPIITKAFSAQLNWSFYRGSMIGSSSDMRHAHVWSHFQSEESSFSFALVKIVLVAIDFELADVFDEESISLLEPFGLFCYLNYTI